MLNISETTEKKGGSFFGIEMSFFVVSSRPKSPFWYRDLFLGIEILHSIAHHLPRLLPGINWCMLFWASTSCKLEVKEISIPKRRSKNLDTPTKTSRYQLKESPLKTISQNFLGRCLSGRYPSASLQLTCFGPDSDPRSTFSGPNQFKIGS